VHGLLRGIEENTHANESLPVLLAGDFNAELEDAVLMGGLREILCVCVCVCACVCVCVCVRTCAYAARVCAIPRLGVHARVCSLLPCQSEAVVAFGKPENCPKS